MRDQRRAVVRRAANPRSAICRYGMTVSTSWVTLPSGGGAVGSGIAASDAGQDTSPTRMSSSSGPVVSGRCRTAKGPGLRAQYPLQEAHPSTSLAVTTIAHRSAA